MKNMAKIAIQRGYVDSKFSLEMAEKEFDTEVERLPDRG
jgi:hypothetical protein